MSELTNQQPTKVCACVHSDPYECARRRDGYLDTDDPHYYRRECECCCHDDEDNSPFWEDDL